MHAPMHSPNPMDDDVHCALHTAENPQDVDARRDAQQHDDSKSKSAIADPLPNGSHLRQKLQQLRQQHMRLRRLEEELDSNIDDLSYHRDVQHHKLQANVQQYHSVLQTQRRTRVFLHNAQQWNVLSDCFCLWYSGPFGTINGHRLGLESPPMPSVSAVGSSYGCAASAMVQSSYEHAGTNQQINGGVLARGDANASNSNGTSATISNGNTNNNTSRGYSLFFSSASASSKAVAPEPLKTIPQATVVTISWDEINSALGYLVCLLEVFQERLAGAFQFSHNLFPMGQTSKIGYKRSPTTIYNLFYHDASFSLFGKRNFNIALQCLVECVHEASMYINERDRTIILPHRMIDVAPASKGVPDFTVGGLTVTYVGGQGVQWTRCMKYLLTNVKWILAYSAKHVEV